MAKRKKVSINEQIRWIGVCFYREKRQKVPSDFGPRHPSWRAFNQARLWMEGLGTLAGGGYKVFIRAQFHYAPGRDRTRVYPNMLANHKATKKWRWYLEWKKRRVGEVIPPAINFEPTLNNVRQPALFRQNAWDLEGFVQSGFTEEEAFLAFPHLFSPEFVLASPGAFVRLRDNSKHYGPEVEAYYHHVLNEGLSIDRMRILYEQCRERQRRNWGRRFSV